MAGGGEPDLPKTNGSPDDELVPGLLGDSGEPEARAAAAAAAAAEGGSSAAALNAAEGGAAAEDRRRRASSCSGMPWFRRVNARGEQKN